MLLSGDVLKRLFKLSQTVWEIPDRYFVSSGMTGKTEIPARGPMYGLLPRRRIGYFFHKKTGVHTCIKIT